MFDGRSGRPYRPDDAPGPLNVYGASKLAGERAVAEAAPDVLIVRTAWVYGPGGANFLATMLRLMAARPEIGVVADQIGTPTSTLILAEALWGLAGKQASGLLHFTDAGVASWYDFAVAIAEEALAAGLHRSRAGGETDRHRRLSDSRPSVRPSVSSTTAPPMACWARRPPIGASPLRQVLGRMKQQAQ